MGDREEFVRDSGILLCWVIVWCMFEKVLGFVFFIVCYNDVLPVYIYVFVLIYYSFLMTVLSW